MFPRKRILLILFIKMNTCLNQWRQFLLLCVKYHPFCKNTVETLCIIWQTEIILLTQTYANPYSLEVENKHKIMSTLMIFTWQKQNL